MKKLQLIALLAAIVLVITILILVPNPGQVLRAQRPGATPAPPATAGPPAPPKASWPVLDQPLTKEQAVVRALEIDGRFATWKESWSQETFQNQPDRISVEWHSDRSYDGDEYGPRVEMGPVWVIAIKGEVKLRRDRPEESYHDGLTYTIGQNSGSFLSWSAGPYVK